MKYLAIALIIIIPTAITLILPMVKDFLSAINGWINAEIEIQKYENEL